MANAWQTIKRLSTGGKVVVTDGEEVTHVVLTIEEYERLSKPSATSPEDMQADPPQSKGLGGHIAKQETPRWDQDDSPTPGSIRIEDLPL